jgi:DNA-binding transcriptional LysR family regulator
VRAGRGLVPTPRALELRGSIGPLVDDAEAALRPAAQLDLARLSRTFTLRTSEGFVENFGALLLARVAREAPGVRLRFLPKPDRDSASLREGRVDLETGVVGTTLGPEIRTQGLFQDRHIGAVRADHPLSKGPITSARYAGGMHVLVSRRGLDRGPVDDALETAGLTRKVLTTVGGFSAALALARASDMIATVPERHTQDLRVGLFCFPLPVALPPLTVSMLWHPRMEADPAHRWLRGCLREICMDTAAGTSEDTARSPPIVDSVHARTSHQ